MQPIAIYCVTSVGDYNDKLRWTESDGVRILEKKHYLSYKIWRNDKWKKFNGEVGMAATETIETKQLENMGMWKELIWALENNCYGHVKRNTPNSKVKREHLKLLWRDGEQPVGRRRMKR